MPLVAILPVLPVIWAIAPLGRFAPALVPLIAVAVAALLLLPRPLALLAVPLLLLAGRRHLLHLVREPGDRRLLAAADIVDAAALVVRVIVAFAALHWPHPGMAAPVHSVAALLHLLLAEGEDDAVVVFGVLEIVLSENRITRGLRVASQGDVLLGNVRRSSANLYVRSVRLEAPGKRVLAFALVMVVILVVAPAPASMLLSLPHRLPFSR